MRLIVIAGPAGSGKTTLADRVAEQWGVPHVDFDVVTRGVVTAQREQFPHLTEPELLEQIKDARYAEFASAVRAALEAEARAAEGSGLTPHVIASAPFTSITQSPALWAAWCAQCDVPEEQAGLFWLDIEPELRLARMRQRGSSRDLPLLDGSATPASVPLPVVAHRRIDAALPLAEQAAFVTDAQM